MKTHVTATIDQTILEGVDRFRLEERRSRSQVIELALERFLRERSSVGDKIVTSPGRFAGAFSREETDAR